MSKLLVADVTKKFEEYGIHNHATTGQGRRLFMAIADDALVSARLAHVLSLKNYKYTVARVEVGEDSVEPADVVPDDWKLAAGSYIVFTINPRRTKKDRSASPASDGGPQKPTKTSSWLEFSKEERKLVKASQPDLAFGDISKEVGRRWKALSDEKKAPWVALAEKVKLERAEAAAAAPQVAPAAGATEQKAKKVTGWILFGKEQRPLIKVEFPDMPFGQVSSELGARWKALGDAGKEAWKERAKNL